MSLGALLIFTLTLYKPPSMIERFARLVEPDLPESGVQWTRKVTMVWCVFFSLNATIALATVFAPTQFWVIYNGCVSYVLMGLLFLGEFYFCDDLIDETACGVLCVATVFVLEGPEISL